MRGFSDASGAGARYCPYKVTGKEEIAARLREIGAYMRLLGEDQFRARAYENAGDALDAVGPEWNRLLDEGRLTEIPGIGKSIAGVIGELAATGSTGRLEELRQHLPPSLLELTRVQGLTLARIRALHDGLGIEGLEDLKAAAQAGRLKTLKGFGEKTEKKLLDAIEKYEQRPARIRLIDAKEIAGGLVTRLAALPEVTRVEVAGSVRRWKETAGSVRLVLESPAPQAAIDACRTLLGIYRVEDQGPARLRVRLPSGVPLELTAAVRSRLGTALVQQTGSRAHVARLEALASARGLDLNTMEADSETALYRSLGLPEIPAELREDAGEIEAALGGDDFSDLVTEADILGMTHCHSTFSDGRATIAEMARAVAARGKSYMTVTDHSPTASYAGGVGLDRMPAQWEEIAAAQQETGLRLLRGTESDILPDGALDYPDDVLGRLDVIIASIHNRNAMDEQQMTERLVRAMQSPFFKIWGHPLGRLVLKRDPIACRVDEILEVARTTPTAIEINGDPYRLDLPPEWIRRARALGLRFVLSTDAHSVSDLDHLPYGVAMARRGGVRRGEVLNALPAAEFAAAVRPLGAGRL